MKNVVIKIGLLASLFSFLFFGAVAAAKPPVKSGIFNMTTESGTETQVEISNPFQIKLLDTGETYSLKDVRVLRIYQVSPTNVEIFGEWGKKGQSQIVSIELSLAESVQGYVWKVKPVIKLATPAE